MTQQCKKMRKVLLNLQSSPIETRNEILQKIAHSIHQNRAKIEQTNNKDKAFAKQLLEEQKINNSLFQRLSLNEEKIEQLRQYPLALKQLPDPLNQILYHCILDDGLVVKKVLVPFGLVATVFESRPEVVIQVACLAIKSANCLLLKGGQECQQTNRLLADLVIEVLQQYSLEDAVFLCENRAEISALLELHEWVDLFIPRGSNQFVRFIQENTKIPVMGHSAGVCTIYVSAKADLQKAQQICCDAKLDYPAACNAVETLLVDEKIASAWLPSFIAHTQQSITIKADQAAMQIAQSSGFALQPATPQDWSTEYNEPVVALKIVKDLQAAVDHINTYSSHHTDAIITEDEQEAQTFLCAVDSASVFHNASTRFADGFVYGLGAEVGISTSKLHARGPVGLAGLTTTKWLLYGTQHCRGDYRKKNYKHKQLL